MNTVPKWGPRLTRLYGEDVKRLEAKHAGKLSPGTSTWEDAVKALSQRVADVGPRKGAQLLAKAADYLERIGEDDRAHLLIATEFRARRAHLVFATYSVGDHPDTRVRETEPGLNIVLHIITCSRSHPRCVAGVPVAYICKHAVGRLFERGHDITENAHATSAFAYVGVLGYLIHRSARHLGGGLNLSFSGLLLTGSLHGFTKTWPRGRALDEAIFDVRAVLETDALGDSQYRLLEQGRIAADTVTAWFTEAVDDAMLAERIPALPRREDTFPAPMVAR